MSVNTSEIDADFEMLAANLAEHRPIDDELKRRIRRRSEKLRDERFKSHGFLNAAVELVREVRDVLDANVVTS